MDMPICSSCQNVLLCAETMAAWHWRLCEKGTLSHYEPTKDAIEQTAKMIWKEMGL